MARRDRRRATWGALTASLVVHLVILIVLAQEVAPSFRTPPPAETDFRVDLVPPPEVPPPPPQPHPRRPPRIAPAAPRPLPRARTEPARAIASRPRPPPPQAPPAPFAPPSRTIANLPAAGAASGAGAGAAGQGRWTVQGEDEADAGVRRVLRATVGCAHEDFAQLRPDERAECDRRMGREARLYTQQLDAMDPQKRAEFIAAAEAQERARASRTGPVQDVMTPCKGNANAGLGCINTPFRHGSGGP